MLVALSGCASVAPANDPWLGRDKLAHFATTATLAAAVTYVAEERGMAACDAPLAGWSVALTVGSAKEWFDVSVRGKYWSWRDMAWNAAGATAGAVAASRCGF